jgi:hypothetical protein
MSQTLAIFSMQHVNDMGMLHKAEISLNKKISYTCNILVIDIMLSNLCSYLIIVVIVKALTYTLLILDCRWFTFTTPLSCRLDAACPLVR